MKKNQSHCWTLGRSQMSEWSTRLFGEGNYLVGILANAIADDYLFQMEHQIAPYIIDMCKEEIFWIHILYIILIPETEVYLFLF